VQTILAARLIKLADRLLKMRSLWVVPAAHWKAFASETLHVWVPLAEKARMSGLKVKAS
jgi:(p)ppGpp synthase/HD superfamily hydrolase